MKPTSNKLLQSVPIKVPARKVQSNSLRLMTWPCDADRDPLTSADAFVVDCYQELGGAKNVYIDHIILAGQTSRWWISKIHREVMPECRWRTQKTKAVHSEAVDADGKKEILRREYAGDVSRAMYRWSHLAVLVREELNKQLLQLSKYLN